MAPDPHHSAATGRAGGGDPMERAVDGAIRLGRAWKALTRERRMAVVAAAVLWLTLFLPWYQASVVGRSFRTRGAAPVGDSISGWAAFGFVQALILIVSAGILLFLFLRAEGRARDVPGGDGRIVTAAGALSLLLVIIGLFSAPAPATHGGYVVSTGLEWGIFLALLSAAGLTWAGRRIHGSLDSDPFLAENRRARQQSREPEGRQRTAGTTEPEPPAPAPAPVRAPDPGAAEALTAAGTRTAPEEPEPESESEPESAPTKQESRSSWRPAERPDWTDPERPVGWLTARPQDPRSEEETE